MTKRPLTAIDHLNVAAPAPHESEDNVYTDAYLITTLQALQTELDRAPTKREVDADPTVASSGLYTNRFGKFSIAVELALAMSQQSKAVDELSENTSPQPDAD